MKSISLHLKDDALAEPLLILSLSRESTECIFLLNVSCSYENDVVEPGISSWFLPKLGWRIQKSKSVRIAYRSSSREWLRRMHDRATLSCGIGGGVGISWHQHVYCLIYGPKTIMFLLSFSKCCMSSWCCNNELFSNQKLKSNERLSSSSCLPLFCHMLLNLDNQGLGCIWSLRVAIRYTGWLLIGIWGNVEPTLFYGLRKSLDVTSPKSHAHEMHVSNATCWNKLWISTK